MIRPVLLAGLAALALFPLFASAGEIKVSYKGVVARATGPQAAVFNAGDSVDFHYVISSTTPSLHDGNQTIYNNNLAEATVSIPALGLDVESAPGSTNVHNNQTTNNTYFYDIASFIGIPNVVRDDIAGHAIDFFHITFAEYATTPYQLPSLFNDTSVPLTHIASPTTYIVFKTSAGFTYVYLNAQPVNTFNTCAAEGYSGAKLTLCQQICEVPQTPARLSVWIKKWLLAYRVDPPCGAL